MRAAPFHDGSNTQCLCVQRDPGGGLVTNRRYKPVVGTDGDLRKLKLSKAKQVLRNFGVPEEEVCYLSLPLPPLLPPLPPLSLFPLPSLSPPSLPDFQALSVGCDRYGQRAVY